MFSWGTLVYLQPPTKTAGIYHLSLSSAFSTNKLSPLEPKKNPLPCSMSLLHPEVPGKNDCPCPFLPTMHSLLKPSCGFLLLHFSKEALGKVASDLTAKSARLSRTSLLTSASSGICPTSALLLPFPQRPWPPNRPLLPPHSLASQPFLLCLFGPHSHPDVPVPNPSSVLFYFILFFVFLSF